MTVSERYALECIAERSATADPGGDLVQRLRLKNRCLEKELVRLTAQREEYYTKRMREAEDQCQRLLKEARDEQSTWYADQMKELRELRAGVTLMHCLMQAKKDRSSRKYAEEKADYELRLHTAREETVRIQTGAQVKVQALEQRYNEMSSGYEARLSCLEEKVTELQEKKSKLEAQASTHRAEVQMIKKEKEEQSEHVLELKKKLEEAERAAESMTMDTRIKSSEARAQREKEKLEEEVMDYVKYIVCTPEARNISPDFPWEFISKPELLLARPRAATPFLAGKASHQRPLRPGWPPSPQQRSVTASPRVPPLPGVEPVKRAGSAMACYAKGR